MPRITTVLEAFGHRAYFVRAHAYVSVASARRVAATIQRDALDLTYAATTTGSVSTTQTSVTRRTWCRRRARYRRGRAVARSRYV